MPLRLHLASLAGGASLLLALVSSSPTLAAPLKPTVQLHGSSTVASAFEQGGHRQEVGDRDADAPDGLAARSHWWATHGTRHQHRWGAADHRSATTGSVDSTTNQVQPRTTGATAAGSGATHSGGAGTTGSTGNKKPTGTTGVTAAGGGAAQSGGAGTTGSTGNKKPTGTTGVTAAGGGPAPSGGTAASGSSGGALTVGAKINGYTITRVLHVVATAYGPSLQDNYPYGPVDASGKPLVPGDIAVDPSVIPMGSHLYVAGYKSPSLPQGGELGWARDTGGAIKGNRIDIFINGNAQQVSNFGVQPVTVYVLS